MKKLFLVFAMLASITVSAQIIVFHPVKVPAELNEKFLDIELNYSQKTAQDAVNKGQLEGWALLKNTNPKPDGYNYIWVNVYKDIASAVNEGGWWNNSKDVVGVETPLLFSIFDYIEMDRRYFYKQDITLPSIAAAGYVILNFSNSDQVDTHLKELEKYVLPHFKKEMRKHGMVGFGVASKITPQGEDVATMMTYDSYDSLENAMIHLSGGGVISGLPSDKITNIPWTMRPLMRVMGSTVPKE